MFLFNRILAGPSETYLCLPPVRSFCYNLNIQTLSPKTIENFNPCSP